MGDTEQTITRLNGITALRDAKLGLSAPPGTIVLNYCWRTDYSVSRWRVVFACTT